jgi:hypothetical protein
MNGFQHIISIANKYAWGMHKGEISHIANTTIYIYNKQIIKYNKLYANRVLIDTQISQAYQYSIDINVLKLENQIYYEIPRILGCLRDYSLQ